MKKADLDEDLDFIDINDDDHPRFLSYESEEDDIYEDDEEDDDEDEDENEGRGFGIFHILFILIAVGLIGVSIFLLIRWQKGIDLVVTEDDLTEDYDVESMDFYIHYAPDEAEGYVDDGELNIVILSDGSMSSYEDGSGIPDIIANTTGAHVDSCELPGGVIATKELGYSLDYTADAYSLYFQAVQITGGSEGSYDLMMAAWDYMEDPSKYYEYWDKLHKVNFNKADIIIINYGTNDYLEAFPVLGSEVAPNQIYGVGDGTCAALNDVLVNMKNRFPYAQILFVSPSFILTTDKDGNLKGADMVNTGEGTLGEYVAQLAYFAGLDSVTFIDNYLGTPFNPDNYEQYLEPDGKTPNAEARQLLAEHIMKYFYFNYNK